MPPGRKKGRKSNAPKRVVQLDNVDSWPTDAKELANYIDGRTMAEFFEAPSMPVSFYEEVRRATDETKLSPHERICYKCPACNDKEYTTKNGLFIHMQKVCAHVPERMFTCLVCKDNFKTQDGVMAHIKQIHVIKALHGDKEETCNNKGRRAARLSRIKVQLYETSSSYAEEFDFHEVINKSTPLKGEKIVKDKDSDYEKEDNVIVGHEEETLIDEVEVTPKKLGKEKPESEAAWQTYSALNKPLVNAFQWTHDYKLKLENNHPVVLTQLMPYLESPPTIPLQYVLEDYLIINESPPFKIVKGSLDKVLSSKKIPKLTKNYHDKDYRTLKTFSSLSYEIGKGAVHYTGGPVWCLAWCCYPLSVNNKDQYLASVSHFGEHILHSNRTYEDSIILQVWNCGKLKPRLIAKDIHVSPKFAYGLAFDVGPVWDLKWCPVGGYIPKTQGNSGRLGLLAMACAIGDVYILSLPENQQENGEIYRIQPSAILMQPSKCRHSFGQCMCVSWSVDDGACQIIAGFASGHIALWDLKATSSFLLSKDNNGVTNIFPFHSFKAHSKPVRGIDFCPFDSNLFCSGGMDRFLKVWDARKTDCDLKEDMSNKLSCIYEVSWPLGYAGVYVATGNTFSIQYHHGALYIHAIPATSPLQHITPNKSTCWSVSSNDWLNVVASGDVAGSVVIMSCNNWNRQNIYQKKIPRALMYQCEGVWDQNDKDEKKVGNEQNGGIAENDKTIKLQESCQMDPNPQYKLVFNDYTVDNQLNNWEKTEAHKRVRVCDNFPEEDLRSPVQAVHKVRWNPNMTSYSWIATATHSGLIRLHCVSGLISDRVHNLSKSYT